MKEVDLQNEWEDQEEAANHGYFGYPSSPCSDRTGDEGEGQYSPGVALARKKTMISFVVEYIR